MLPTVWTDVAVSDMEQLVAYIGERNPRAATALRNLIVGAAERLGEHPYLYREGRRSGTREAVVHPNYLLVYRVGLRVVTILRVLHATQRYP